MGLLFGGKPEEVPFRRKVLRSLVYAGMKAGTFAILAPVFKGEAKARHCRIVAHDTNGAGSA